jgi:zinc/manganese transport system substrate-binding protein
MDAKRKMTALKKLLCTVALTLTASAAQAKLNVVATLPDFAAIAREIGGEHVKVTSLALGTEDPHYVDAKPSFIRVLNQADVLIEGGADLEIGWLPPLVEGARNRDILPGGRCRVDASVGVPLLEIPTGPVDRSQGDVHAAGNPHYMLDPMNGKIVATQLAERLARLDPANAGRYQENLRRFSERLDARMKEWERLMTPLRGTKAVAYHKSFEYLAKRFGIEIVAYIEPKPGIEPSAAYVTDLVARLREASVRIVLVEPNRSPRTPESVARALGATIVTLPVMVEGHPKARDYFTLFDHLASELVRATNGPSAPPK